MKVEISESNRTKSDAEYWGYAYTPSVYDAMGLKVTLKDENGEEVAYAVTYYGFVNGPEKDTLHTMYSIFGRAAAGLAELARIDSNSYLLDGTPRKLALLSEVGVHPGYRGKGYGRDVVLRALRELQNRKVAGVYLHASPIAIGGEPWPKDWHAKRERLVKFYETLGFQVTDEVDQEVEEEEERAIYMVQFFKEGTFGGFGRGWRR